MPSLARLRERGVGFHMIDLGGNVSTNGVSKPVFTIPSAVAEAERDRTRERVAEVKLNIAADIVAMGEVSELVRAQPPHRHLGVRDRDTASAGVHPVSSLCRLLKWLTLSLLAYAGVVFLVHVPWAQVALRTVWPRLTLGADAATLVVAVFGTTISPYLFFWQASEEVKDLQRRPDALPLRRDPNAAPLKRASNRRPWTGGTAITRARWALRKR
jgi:hypothetical protein